MSILTKAISNVVETLINTDGKRAVKYLDAKTVVSACRRFKRSSRAQVADFVLKIDAPNYLERKFISACKAAGEPFPVKKVQIKAWPVKRT